MTLRDKMLAVMKDVNSQVAEREELVELIAIALLTRNNLFILGKPGQAKSLSINLFRQRITGARQFERLLSKQTDEDQLFGRIDLSSLIPGSVPDAVLQDDDVHKNLRFDLQSMVDGLGARKDTPDTFAMLEKRRISCSATERPWPRCIRMSPWYKPPAKYQRRISCSWMKYSRPMMAC